MKKLLLIVTLCFCATTVTADDTNITINNPKAADALIQIKCNHQYKTNTYKFYKQFWIMRRSSAKLTVPSGMKDCEIWVIDVKVF